MITGKKEKFKKKIDLAGKIINKRGKYYLQRGKIALDKGKLALKRGKEGRSEVEGVLVEGRRGGAERGD